MSSILNQKTETVNGHMEITTEMAFDMKRYLILETLNPSPVISVFPAFRTNVRPKPLKMHSRRYTIVLAAFRALQQKEHAKKDGFESPGEQGLHWCDTRDGGFKP